MADRAILDQVNSARERFKKPCTKYVGAVAIEVIRGELQAHGFEVSPRDVFIDGLPIEFDLLITRSRITPEDGVLYAPRDVLAVFEIKTAGSFGEETVNRVKMCFEQVQGANPAILCVYLTLEERESFSWKVTCDNIPGRAYTLFWWNQKNKQDVYRATGDWEMLITDLHRHIVAD